MAQVLYGSHGCAEVEPGLICGSWRAIKHIRNLAITHVLSVYNLDVHDLVGDVDHMHICVSDIDETNLLEFLQQAHAYIDQALQQPNGRILVHCFAGMSRSVSVIVSYLMKKKNMSLEEGLSFMDKRYPHPVPNNGFRYQLELFHESEYDYDKALESYLKRKGLRYRKPPKDDPKIRHFTRKEQQTQEQCSLEEHTDFGFECRKCHRCLGDSTSVHDLTHLDVLQESGSMFVEQLDWIQEQSNKNQVSGKLYCPDCKEKLGSFNWAGIKDSTVWHVPAFQLHLNKLDVRPKSARFEPRIHQPKLLPDARTNTAADNGVMTYDFVVFDCDGVLVNTEVSSCESLYRCIRDVTGFEIPREFPVDYYEVFGMDVRSCLEHYNKKYQHGWNDLDEIAEKAALSKEQHYRQLTAEHGIQAFDGVTELITKLKTHHVPYGVASSGHPSKIERNLQQSGLMNLFDPNLVVSASEVEKGKPAPDVYLEAFSRIGCEQCSSKCLVIEDSINGLIAAKAAGAFCVGITNSLPRELLQPHADLVVDHISEIEQFISMK